MFIDYLDPFWPVRSPEPTVDRRKETQETSNERPVREDSPREPAYDDSPERYDERGKQIDEYA